MIEGHGDDLYLYGDRVRHNFSTNIVSGTRHEGLTEFLHGAMAGIGSYPEPAPFSLERMIAGKIGVDAANVVVTNGATDAMYRIAHLLAGKSSAIRVPAFREYQDACRANRHRVRFFTDMADVRGEEDCLWLCSPNNPTGDVTDKSLLLDMAAERDGRWMVVDQAYADYTLRPTVAPAEAVESGSMVLLSSLTKRYAVPGLRIGYAVAPSRLASRIREAGMPWAVNTLAIEAGKYLIGHDADYPIDAAELHNETLRIAAAFRRMGIACSESHCNFILCCLPQGAAPRLKRFLVEEYGILIRDASNFEGLDDRYFRVAAQTPAENDMLIEALEKWMS